MLEKRSLRHHPSYLLFIRKRTYLPLDIEQMCDYNEIGLFGILGIAHKSRDIILQTYARMHINAQGVVP